MKNYITTKLLTMLLLLSAAAYGQGIAINEDGAAPDPSAMLEVTSTEKGILIPRMTQAQREAISAPANGLLIFQTDETSGFYFNAGTTGDPLWQRLGDEISLPSGSDMQTLRHDGAGWVANSLLRNNGAGLGVGANPFNNTQLYLYRPTGNYGAGYANIYAIRNGHETASIGGTSWSRTGVDAAIKGFSNWGNNYSAAVAGYGYLDYPNSAAVIGSYQNGNNFGSLAFRDANNIFWAGYFKGNVNVTGTMRIQGGEPGEGKVLTSDANGAADWQPATAAVGSALSCIDIDGNAYPTIIIGDQIWMAENLRVTKYRNGNTIPIVTTNAAWTTLTSGALCWYDNWQSTNAKYGPVYNWHAVNDPRGLCPEGWRAPTDDEWTAFTNMLGGSSVAGGKLKAVSTLWNSPNTDATNSTGFSGLPGGLRRTTGAFNYIGTVGFWWSATENSSTRAWSQEINFSVGNVFRNDKDKISGLSVRCLRDIDN
jgi:uncharacterized protein (TIGR02145 family)